MKVLVLNGVNLGRLGMREPEVYGTTTYAELVTAVDAEAARLGHEVELRQTDDEGQLVRWLHEAADSGVAVILNAAAWTHYSVAVRDAAAQLRGPLIEVHLSNPAGREEFRHTSLLSGIATGVIQGFGIRSYLLALQALSG